MPYAPLDVESVDGYGAECARVFTAALSRHPVDVDCGPAAGTRVALRPVQGAMLAALHDAALSGVEGLGAIGAIDVGFGKTLIGELAGEAVRLALGLDETPSTLLLVPPEMMRGQHSRDRQWARLHFEYTPPTAISHGRLSMPESSTLLERLGPKVIVIDEAHAFRNDTAARTKRLIRYVQGNPHVRVLILSGTLSARSILDYAHLAEIALRDRSPLPLSNRTAIMWANVLDVDGEPDRYAHSAVKPLVEWAAGRVEFEPGASATTKARLAYGERFRSLPGVVATESSACEASLVLRQWKTLVPVVVRDALKAISNDWILPDGTEIVSALDWSRHAATISSGFFQRWTVEPAEDWLDVRRTWFASLRSFLDHRAGPGLDSPGLVSRAVSKGTLGPGLKRKLDAWIEVREQYGRHAGIYGPPTVAVWIDDFLPSAVADWRDKRRAKGERGIVWYQSPEIAARLRRFGFSTYGAGTDSPHDRVDFPACSIRVHGRGKNLQAWADGLVVEPPTSGQVWQQLLGRTHRPGQAEYVVRMSVAAHTWVARQAIERATADAAFIEQTGGGMQKLGFAAWNHEPEINP